MDDTILRYMGDAENGEKENAYIVSQNTQICEETTVYYLNSYEDSFVKIANPIEEISVNKEYRLTAVANKVNFISDIKWSSSNEEVVIEKLRCPPKRKLFKV